MNAHTMLPSWKVALCMAALASLGACGRNQPEAQPSEEHRVSVNVVTVAKRPLQAWIYGQGTARSRRREFLNFTREGLVTHVDQNLRVGSAVKAGQVIAYQAPERISADLQAARATLAEAQAGLALAEANLRRYQILIEQRSASQLELEQAALQVQQARAAQDSARARVVQTQVGFDESRLVSPIQGVLARLNVEQGRYFTPAMVQVNNEQNALRTVPALVIDPTRFEVRVDLPSYEFPKIRKGARAVISATPPPDGRDVDPHANGDTNEGRVFAVGPSLDPDSRTFQVIVHTEGGEARLQDGAFVALWIAEPAAGNALAVPLQALRFHNDQSFLFVVDPKTSKVTERRVELGQTSEGFRAIKEGVEEGEWVVTDGRAALNAGQTVRILQRDGHAP
ncbi:efflux RND transporter periplasmic adaptor subunit [Uliginosibacterium sp. sgz301328]|uniref:efflux RND transporter periplasmic adaptor subunit n=1 Tax=Uliginosibacterium sp. sgz301328 TaxID=3243764 RepID=UPI00359DDD05